MNQTYAISCITPIYNSSRYLEKSVTSLLEQDFENVEFIFVDDGSTDDSVEMLHKIIEQYPARKAHIKIEKHDTNKGSGAARSTGLMRALGEFTIQLDSDDWFEGNALSTLYQQAKNTNSDIVVCDYFKNYSSDHNVYIKQNWNIDFSINMRNLILGKLHGSLCNKLIKRELYTNNSIYPPMQISLLEDKWVMIRLFFYADKMTYIPKALLYYRQDNNVSIVHQVTSKHWYDFFWYKKTTKAFLYETGNNKYLKYLMISNLYIYTALFRKMILNFLKKKLF